MLDNIFDEVIVFLSSLDPLSFLDLPINVAIVFIVFVSSFIGVALIFSLGSKLKATSEALSIVEKTLKLSNAKRGDSFNLAVFSRGSIRCLRVELFFIKSIANL